MYAKLLRDLNIKLCVHVLMQLPISAICSFKIIVLIDLQHKNCMFRYRMRRYCKITNETTIQITLNY